MVPPTGFEPVTSSLPMTRKLYHTHLLAPKINYYNQIGVINYSF